MIAQRYERNIGTITEEENEKLQACSVWVAGCGGLGGYIICLLYTSDAADE